MPEKADDINGIKENGRDKRKLKGKILVFFGVLLLLLVVLSVLNSIDFDKLIKVTDKKQDDSDVITYEANRFTTPDYDEDITEDADYMEKIRTLHYSYGNETFEVVGNAAEYGSVCVFFQKYFDAVISGDIEAYNTLFTEEYLTNNGTSEFTAQKLYNIYVTCKSTVYLENGDAQGKYKGGTLYYFDVSYNIWKNNGTFRNDFFGDDATLPVVFQIIESNGDIRISQISRYSYRQPSEKTDFNYMLIIWIVVIIVFFVAELLTRRLMAVIPALSALIPLIMSISGSDCVTQISWFLIITTLLFVARLTFLKKIAKKFIPSAKTGAA